MARSNSGGGLTPSARPFRSPLFPRRLAFLPGSLAYVRKLLYLCIVFATGVFIYRQTSIIINAVRLLARDESAVFFSASFVRPDQAAALYTLPAGGWIYLRWVTTALCCTGCFYTLRASGFSTPQSIPSLQSSLPRSSIGFHGKALVVKARGQTSKCSVLTVRLIHSLRFAVTACFLTSFPVMQALRL